MIYCTMYINWYNTWILQVSHLEYDLQESCLCIIIIIIIIPVSYATLHYLYRYWNNHFQSVHIRVKFV